MSKVGLCTSKVRVPADKEKGVPAQTVRCVRNDGHPAGAPGAHMGAIKCSDGTIIKKFWS